MPTRTYPVIEADGSIGSRTETYDISEDNRTALLDKARQALTTNATYLAIATPTAAQNTAQVQRLTRECTILFRILLGALDTTEGT